MSSALDVPRPAGFSDGSWLDNLKISLKIAVAPAATLVALMALVIGACLAFQGLRSDFRTLNEEAFARYQRAARLETVLSQFHAGLYRFTSFAANESDKVRLAEQARDLVKGADALTRAGSDVAGQDQKVIGELGKELLAYDGAARQVIEMVQADAGLGLILMADAETAFGRLKARLGALAVDADAARQKTYEQAVASIDRALMGFGLAAAFATGVAVLAAFFVTRAIGRPIEELTRTMSLLASGDLAVRIPAVGRRDEVGAMARAVEVFKETATEADRLSVDRAEGQRLRDRRTAALENLVREFESGASVVLLTLNDASRSLDETAQRMASSVQATASRATMVATASEQAAANVQTVASAAEQLSASIVEVNGQIVRSTEIVRESANEARRTDTTMQTLANAGERIGSVVNLIRQIAGQTNLLALNATIEAARAGDAGKGFAVVATEVKSLASQTAQATEEIAAQIADMQRAATQAIAAIQGINGTVSGINEITGVIAAAVSQQQAATAEIARSAAEAASGTHNVTGNIGGVSEASVEMGASAQSVLQCAREFTLQSQALGRLVDEFLLSVRAA